MQDAGITRIDFDSLVNRWARWWVKKYGAKLEWAACDEEKEEEFKSAFLPHLDATTQDFSRVFGKKLFVSLVGAGPTTVQTDENFKKNCRRNDTVIDSEGTEVGYQGDRILRSELRTDVTIGIGGEFSVGIGNPQILGFGISLSGKVERTKSNAKGTENVDKIIIKPRVIPVDHVCVIEQLYNQFQYVQEVEISGYVVVSCSKNINPGIGYTEETKEWKKWAVPVAKVLDDLVTMKANGELADEDQLAKFEVDRGNNRVIFKLHVTEEKATEYRERHVLKDEVMKDFKESVEKLKLKHRKYCKKTRVDTLFTGKISTTNKQCMELETEKVEGGILSNVREATMFKDILSGAEGNAAYRVLIGGEPGIGKTTLIRKLMSRWGALKPDSRKHYPFEWVFYIALGNLNDRRYPIREDKPYSVAEIITRECFPEIIFPEIKQLAEIKIIEKQKSRSLWHQELEKMWRAGKVLLILDGYEERPKHGALMNLFAEMRSSRYVIFSSRVFDENEALERDAKVARVTVKGFSEESATGYVSEYFNKNSVGLNKMRDCLSKPRFMELCRTPFLLESICFLVAGDSNSIDLNALDRFEKAMYEQLMISISRRFLTKFSSIAEEAEQMLNKDYNSGNPLDLTPDRVYDLCKFEFGFLEYFAFSLLRTDATEASLSDSNIYVHFAFNKQVEEQTDERKRVRRHAEHAMLEKRSATRVQSDFGFLSLTETDRGSGDYRFIHPIFRNYFAARYLAQCLQRVFNSAHYSQVSTFPHVWVNNCFTMSVVEYIKNPDAMGASRDLVLKYIGEILIAINDVSTNSKFEQLIGKISIFTRESVVALKGKIKKMIPSNSHYSFELSREDSCLLIQYKSSTDKKKGYILGALHQALKDFFELKLTEQEVKVEDITENDCVTIRIKDPDILDAIALCLREITAPALDDVPLTHFFFAGSKLLQKGGKEFTEEERSSISCIMQ